MAAERLCEYSKCRKKFAPSRKNQRFCEDTCRAKAWRERNLTKAPEIMDRIIKAEARLKEMEKAFHDNFEYWSRLEIEINKTKERLDKLEKKHEEVLEKLKWYDEIIG